MLKLSVKTNSTLVIPVINLIASNILNAVKGIDEEQ